MAAIQAVREVPLPKEEIVADCRNMGSVAWGVSSVMLAIAKKQTIREIMKNNEKEKLEPEVIRLETELLYLLLFEKGIIDKRLMDCVIKVGEEYSEFMIVDKSNLVFSRSFKNGERFLEEINRSLSSYKKYKNARSPESLKVVYWQGIDIKNTRSTMLKNFTIPVSFYELKEDLAEYDLLAQINLMPSEISEKNIKIRQKKELVLTCLLSVFVFMLSVMFISFKTYEKKEILNIVSSRLEALQPDVDKLEGYLKKARDIEVEYKRSRVLSGIIARSYKDAPRHVSLSGFSYDGRKNFYLNGIAKNMSTVLIFVRKLENTGYFHVVEVKRAAKNIVKGQEFTDFNIQCGLAI